VFIWIVNLYFSWVHTFSIERCLFWMCPGIIQWYFWGLLGLWLLLIKSSSSWTCCLIRYYTRLLSWWTRRFFRNLLIFNSRNIQFHSLHIRSLFCFIIVCKGTELRCHHRATTIWVAVIIFAQIFVWIKYKFILVTTSICTDWLHHFAIGVQLVGAEHFVILLTCNIAHAIIVVHPGHAFFDGFVLWGSFIHNCFLVLDICVVDVVDIIWSYLFILELFLNHFDLPLLQDVQARNEIWARLRTLEASLVYLLQPR